MSNTHSFKNQFGETIRKAREKADLGVREAALKMRINPGYLSSLENNTHKSIPSDEIIRKISNLFGIKFEELRVMSISIAPDLRAMREKLTAEEAEGMQAFYRFTKKTNVNPLEAVNRLEKLFKDKS